MSFQEKSLWVTLVGLLLAFGAALYSGLINLSAGAISGDVTWVHAGAFIGATVVLLVVMVVGHVVLAIADRRTQPDERDEKIALRSGQQGSWVLACGVFFSLCAALVSEGNAVMAHVLLGSWVLAQMVETVSGIVMYRREA